MSILVNRQTKVITQGITGKAGLSYRTEMRSMLLPMWRGNHAIAGLLPEKDLREDFVVVDAFDPRVAPAVAAAVAKVAIETDVARVKIDPEVIRRTSCRTNRHNHKGIDGYRWFELRFCLTSGSIV